MSAQDAGRGNVFGFDTGLLDQLAPAGDGPATITEARRSLGLDPGQEPPRRREPGPDTAGLADELGLA